MSVSIGDHVYFLQDYIAKLANGRTYKRYAAGSTYTADAKNIDFLDAGVTARKGYITGGPEDAQILTLIGLADGPKSYVGHAGDLIVVNMTEDGFEFVPFVGGSGFSGGVDFFTDLADVPHAYSSGDAGKLLAVNATEDGLEFIDPPTGGIAGTPPSIVQFAHSNTSNSVAFGVAPTNGNLLVAICVDTGSGAGTGWTAEDTDAGGAAFGLIATKVAGVGESTTQTPMAAGSNNVMVICAWEITGQAVSSPVLFANSSTLGAAHTAYTQPAVSSLADVLNLGAIQTEGTPQTLTGCYGMSQDVLNNAAAFSHYIAGHSDAGSAAVAQLLTRMMGSTANTRQGIIQITA